MILDPTVEGGHSIDNEPNHLTGRLPGNDERDNIPSTLPRQAKSRWERMNDEIEFRGRWRAACERMAQRTPKGVESRVDLPAAQAQTAPAIQGALR
jgi:hypothetical protein